MQPAEDGKSNRTVAEHIGDSISRVCLAMAATALLAIVSINFANVVGRYGFGSPFSWAEESMLFLMIVVVFAAVPAVTWRNQHIRIDMLSERLRPSRRSMLLLAVAIISIAIFATVSLSGLEIVLLLREFDQRSDALHLPIWIPQGFLSAGMALSALLVLAGTILSRLR